MANIPTDEDVGMAILKIYESFGTRPNEALLLQNIMAKIQRFKGFRMEDVNRGLKYLIDNKMVIKKNDMTFFLTEDGFKAI